MTKKEEKAKRERLDSIRLPAILALRGVQIGPIWPNPLELADIPKGKRLVPRKKTVHPFNDEYRKNRRIKNRQASRSRMKNG